MAQKVKITMEDGSERIGFMDMRTFRDQRTSAEKSGPALDLAKPLTMRGDSRHQAQIRIWFIDARRIYGAYRYWDTQDWILHAWFPDGSALARRRPHNNDLIYLETSEKGAAP